MKVPYFKLGYWNYRPADNIETRIAEVRRDVAGLVSLGARVRHGGGIPQSLRQLRGRSRVGRRAPSSRARTRTGSATISIPCHATAEGGEAGWNIAMRMALPRIKMVALKDFYWEKANGKWTMRMCPIGEGMVKWPEVFALLASAHFAGPLSLHLEYEPADMAAIARDLAFVKKQVAAAYGR